MERKRIKTVLLATLLASAFMAYGLTMSVHETSGLLPDPGPTMDSMLVHIYPYPDAMFADFELCNSEIFNRPATSYWIQRWINMPEITMKAYHTRMELASFSINNQRWPTGWDTPLEYDPKTGTYKHYYNDSDPTNINCRLDWCAQEFRKALCYLTNKGSMGTGYTVYTFVPIPVLEGYTDYADLAAKGLIYWYNPDIAVQVLKNAGFQDFDGDTRRDDWQDPGPDLTWGTGDDGSIEYDSYGDLIFYIRMDDLNLMQAGLLLASGMQAVSIPVKEIITEESVCRRQVKVLYDYHLYTELRYYEDTWVPTWLYTEWNSQFYWAPQPFSPNYPGFCNREYDYWSEKFYTATTPDELLESALKCQEIMANYTGSIPVWCPPPDAVKAYKTKYDGVVNDFAVGVDNYYSFLLMNDTGPSDGVIHWGFCPDIEGVHVICAEWLWDWKTIGLIYESMISRQPYDKTIGSYDYWLATDYTVGTWGTEGYTEVNFTIRTGVVWQDGVAFAPADVVFSLEFTRHCGRGVAWNFAGVQYLNTTWAEGNRIIVRLNTAKPLTGVEDLGFLPIVPKHIWEAKYPNWEDWYNETTGRWSDDRFVVRNWKPWEEPHPIYNATNPHPINGVLTKAIGTGAWIFDTHVANQYIALHANRLYYKTQAQVEADIKEMFWKLGDANGNMVVDGMDVLMLQACWPPNPYDPRCDFNKDGVIDVLDAFLIFKNFGRRGDC